MQVRKLRRTMSFIAVFVVTFILSSCSIPFVPEVPPGSYSVEAAINVIANKYMLMDTGWINGFGDMELGEGRYATFDGVDGFLMVFRYDDFEQAKDAWNKITKKYGNPFKLKYLKINMGTYGVFTIRLENTDLYCWYKENWLFIVTGDKIERFVMDINNIYKTIKK
ncbi:Protein of unknown function [Fervidobacterium changbaicum]|nr:Protein of unknown function [Fervidobacterium changbaicum]